MQEALMSGQFEKNCKYFEQKNARARALLSQVVTKSLVFCKTAEGEDNLQDTKTSFFFHSPKNAAREAADWVKSLDLKDCKVLCVWGVGLGYGYLALKNWLQEEPSRQVVFLEDTLGVLERFFHTQCAKDLLNDPQVHLYYIENSNEGGQVLQNIAWGTFPDKVSISALPAYAQARHELFEEIKNRLIYEVTEIHAVLDEYLVYGAPFFRNYWRNLFLLPGSYKGNKLQSRCKDIPAIIVAAGPSLGQHLELIKSLGDKALIFAGGSAVNALSDAGILPHFGVGIDPNPTQYRRLRQSVAFEVPFFYRGRMLHEALQQITGPRLYLKGGDGYNISDWFEEKLHIPGTILGGGHSVANFSIEIAKMLGCNPIILVGFDLSYGEGLKTYAKGVEVGERELDTTKAILWQGVDGKTVHTEWKWIVEANWIQDFKEKHPRLSLINSSCGIEIEGISHVRLQEVEKKYLQNSYDLQALVHALIVDAGKFEFSNDEIVKYLTKMYSSLIKVQALLDKILLQIEKRNKKKSLARTPLIETAECLLLCEEMSQEPAWRYLLDVFDRCRTKLDISKIQFLSHECQTTKKEQELQLILEESHFRFLKEVASLNQLLMIASVQEAQKKGIDVGVFQQNLEKNNGQK